MGVDVGDLDGTFVGGDEGKNVGLTVGRHVGVKVGDLLAKVGIVDGDELGIDVEF